MQIKMWTSNEYRFSGPVTNKEHPFDHIVEHIPHFKRQPVLENSAYAHCNMHMEYKSKKTLQVRQKEKT